MTLPGLLLLADARAIPLADESVQCVVTSPPYWGLRDYGVEGQIGLERTPAEYVTALVNVFREIRRVLKKDGICWLNLGDCFHSGDRGGYRLDSHRWEASEMQAKRADRGGSGIPCAPNRLPQEGLKDKDLVGIPWRVALALQADGWWLRSDIIWSKPNPMPESVRDRPTRSHEYIFLLVKSERYYYDSEAIAEPIVYGDHPRNGTGDYLAQAPGQPVQSGLTKRRRSGNKERVMGPGRARPGSHLGASIPWEDRTGRKNARSVWSINVQPYPEAHFATFPEDLARRLILAGSRPGDLVLDPFSGSGTVGRVCSRFSRLFVGLDINPAYHHLARKRMTQVQMEAFV